MQNRRTERTTFLSPFWKLDSHYNLIDFHKDFDLAQAEDVELFVEGKYVEAVNVDKKAGPSYSILDKKPSVLSS
ncbi:hypothetical protein [Spirosoma litoris]